MVVNVRKLTNDICQVNKLPSFNEIQIDCDWTSSTKESYFKFLKLLRQDPFFNSKQVSATIRLHQLKYKSITGVPPLNKGLLMCYNMGDLKDTNTINSIIELKEAKKYLGHLSDYNLSLDIGLPIFSWYVWFRQGRFKGLISSEDLKLNINKNNKWIFQKDSILNGYTFEKGDWLRYEESKADDVVKLAELLNDKIKNEQINVVLYHLDEGNINKYTIHELENIFVSIH